MGVLHVTRALLPGMMERKRGHVIMVGSVAGHHGYAGGSVYCATKSAIWSLVEAMRRETLGQGIRVTTVDPGLVDTEFSPVRFEWDEEKAAKVYEGLEPCTPKTWPSASSSPRRARPTSTSTASRSCRRSRPTPGTSIARAERA
jgi:3-hydroxy acid dehydrogenase/malonic semialdehyde reductase